MRRWAGLAAAGLMAAGVAQAAPQTPSQQIVGSHIVGRYKAGTVVTRTKDSATIFVTSTYQWPGTYIEAAFMGDEISIRLNDSANILRVFIDGKFRENLTKPGATTETLTGLGAGQHVIRIERLTETQGATGTFEGLFAPAGPRLAIQPRTRQIEFIGDSYTVGYGNTSTKRECTQDEIWATTNTQKAFGPLTAKHFNADYQINAYSGRGIVRNYDGFIGDPLPALYPYALYDGKTEYSDADWHPQIIVIALGGNDFSTPVHATGEKWANLEELRADYIASYVTFVTALRARHPQASFLLADYGEREIIDDITEVVKRLTASGETRVAPLSLGSGFELTGCDWHLNTADDKRISDTLVTYLDAHPELWQGQ